ncbi:MAG: Lrp/AsnC family transcriptional regulator [Firmicutes bacterium]|nr:Lrp/AsnC family transcriptional regulator [Bacillota bacterium]
MNLGKKMLDETDLRILNILQENGRVSMKALGQEIAMSPVAAADRVNRLEDAGIIQSYGARISRPAMGLVIHAFIMVDCVPPSRRRSFLELVREEDRIVACYQIVSGGKTAMLDVYCESVERLSQLQSRLNSISPTYTYLAAVDADKDPGRAL